ncbi:MAG: type II secretion system protein [Candidatus Paceibacterota bacterium]|jgi:type II secretory pathway pseudopilin PulG
MFIKLRNIHTAGGYSLIEMMIYVVVLSSLLTVVIFNMITMSRSYGRAVVAKNINNSAVDTIERLTREVRNATSIASIQVSPGGITLNTKDSSGNATTEQIYTDNGTIKLRVGGVDFGPLTLAHVQANVAFTQVTATTSKAVRMVSTLSNSAFGYSDTKTFYSAVVLRGAY